MAAAKLQQRGLIKAKKAKPVRVKKLGNKLVASDPGTIEAINAELAMADFSKKQEDALGRIFAVLVGNEHAE